MNKITVFVVDDHPIFRQGVVDSLSLDDRLHIIGQAANGLEALTKIELMKPQIAVVDVNLPGMNGHQLTHELRMAKSATRVVLMTAYHDSEQVLHAAIAGAYAYCPKDIEPEKLLHVVMQAVQGNYVVGEQVFTRRELENWLERQLESARRSYSEPGSPFHPLSDREMDVLRCMLNGLSNKEIAFLLGISHQTVKNHVTAILRKFNVDDRTQAVVYALKRGWLNLNDAKINS
jgi:DNA-binding NarL/FixJ family response regulator